MTDLSIVLLLLISLGVGVTAGVMWAWREATDMFAAVLREKVEHGEEA